MRIEAVRRTGTFRRRLALTPLIDIIFLLLLFFMLSSTFQRPGLLKVLAGEAGAKSAASVPGVVVRVDGGGALRINGEDVDGGAAGSMLTGLRAAGGDGAMVTAGAVAAVSDLTAALDALAAAGFQNVRVLRRGGSAP